MRDTTVLKTPDKLLLASKAKGKQKQAKQMPLMGGRNSRLTGSVDYTCALVCGLLFAGLFSVFTNVNTYSDKMLKLF